MTYQRFRTKTDGYNRRKQVWICSACEAWHHIKNQQCACGAGSKAFNYFPSTAEARRYVDLKLMQTSKLISNLTLQPNYPIIINGVCVCTYRADFMYENERGEMIVEDVKGNHKHSTDLSKLKINLAEASYNMTVTIFEPGK